MDLFTSVSRRLVVGLVMSLACVLAYADNPDGTYRLVMRKLSDGTVLTAAGGAGNGHLQERGVPVDPVLAHPGREDGGFVANL